MNVLHSVFNDENTICESLESFLEHFFDARTLPYQTVRDIGDLILCYSKTECQQPKELHKCVLSWDECQEFIVFCVLKQDPQQLKITYEFDLKLHPISLSIESLLKNRAWKQLYEFVGTEIMKIIFTKCYINVGIGNNSYLCLYTKEIRQFYKKNDDTNKELTSYNRNFHNTGLTGTPNRKLANSGYKGNMSLSLRKSMYRANIFPYWPVSHILSRSNLESKIVSNVIDDILQEDVGVEVSTKDIQGIKDKLCSLKNLLTYLVRKHKRMAPYSKALQNVLHRKVPNNSEMEVNEETGNFDCIPCKEIFSINTQLSNSRVYNKNTTDKNSERKRKLNTFINDSDCLVKESFPSSERNFNFALTMKNSDKPLKKLKLDNILVRECNDRLKINEINVQLQTKKACSTKQSITSYEKYTLICEKRKNKFLRLKSLPVHIVKEFLHTVLKQILHKKLFAIEKNWAEFFNFLNKFLTAGKDCSFIIKDVLNKIDSRCIKWLMEVPMQFRKTVLAKFLKWIWNKIIVCIVAVNFYVTEFSHCKNKIVFYEKRVWRSLEDTVFSHLLSDRKIVPISRRQWEEYCKLRNCGKFRILPKVDGARPILISKKTKGDYNLLVSKIFLQQLNVHSGTSIHSMNANELNSTWTQVITKWKNMGKPKLYFVGVDIRDAYGSVILDKLMEIIKSNTKVILGKEKSVVFKKLTCVKMKKGQLYWSSVAHFVSLPFVPPHNCVLFDSGEDKEFSIKTILTTIRNSIKCQTIQRGTKKFLISQGITQGGSPLSYELCDIYYSALDKTYLSMFKNDTNDFFIRSVDDYLYITPDVSRARKFKDIMHKGFPDFGVFINPEKTKYNFNCVETHMVFCGYLVDCNTLEVRPSFSCYSNVEIQHTIVFNSVNNPGRFLVAKMDQLNAVKLNRFTLDLKYNSVLTVYRNVFEASILLACRFVTIIVKLFEVINTEFLINQVLRSASYVVCTVCRLSGATGGTCIDFSGNILWIVYRAFHVMLKKKGDIFYDVVRNLNPLMYSIQAKISISNRNMMKHATDIKQLPQSLKFILR